MNRQKQTPASACHQTRTLVPLALVAACFALAPAASAQGQWPPAPPMKPATAVEAMMPLPPSISAESLREAEWRCKFRFRPVEEADDVALVGSFNSWDRSADPLHGPDASGDWIVEVDLPSGMHEYKFVVNETDWRHDPVNPNLLPDGFGHHNSYVRLGQLARMRKSDAELGDGKINPVGIAHRPPAPLYVQAVGEDQVLIRYRTLSNDVQNVSLAIRDGQTIEMPVVSKGPLFTFREASINVPEPTGSRSPKVRSFEYTFVLDDGGGRVGDPHTYRYSFTESGIFSAPDWAKSAVWYQIMLDRFRNGDAGNDPQPVRPWTSDWFTPAEWEGKDGQTFYQNFVFDRHYGGDLAGLEEKLPYLKSLGVNTLYLTPVFKAPSYHKYDVQNYIHIDDQFGENGDYDKVVKQEDLLDPSTWQWTTTDKRFLEFVKKAHDAGFKIVLDAVFNHVGRDHPAFKDVQENGPRSRYADWFEVTSWEPFAYKYWARFAHMPVFRKNRNGFASDTLKAHLFAVTERWMDPDGDGDPSDGIDGWRLDVPNDIPRPFWSQWRRHVKQINPDALITGEVWHRADRWLDGRHFDAVMNYEFARTAVNWIFDEQTKCHAVEAAARLGQLRLAYPKAANFVLQNLVSSHDTDRLASMAANPDRIYDRQNRVQDNNPDYSNERPSDECYARARLAALLQMTYVGAPMIWYGDEVGMWGADDPSNRKPMLWKDLEPYENPEEDKVQDEQLEFYKQAIALRNAHPALQTGAFESLLADDTSDVMAFCRSGNGEQLVVVLNPSKAEHVVHVPVPNGGPDSWNIVFGGEGTLSASGDKLSVPVPAIGGVVLHAAQ
jgi:glycosidase